MFLQEPPPTQVDLHFQLFGFRVRVSPFFWVLALVVGWGLTGANGPQVLMWICAVFVSILIHELGHAFAFRRFGMNARIVLHHFGGVAIPESAGSWSSSVYSPSSFGGSRDSKQMIMIAAAGPAAQIALAGLVLLAVGISGHYITQPRTSTRETPETASASTLQAQETSITAPNDPPLDDQSAPDGEDSKPPSSTTDRSTSAGSELEDDRVAAFHRSLRPYKLPFAPEGLLKHGAPLASDPINNMAFYLVWPSIVWALLNLIPIFPLDGGQISRQLFLLYGGANAMANSLMLSIVCGAGGAVWGLLNGQPFIGIMFGVLAYFSFRDLQQYQGRGGGFGGRPW